MPCASSMNTLHRSACPQLLASHTAVARQWCGPAAVPLWLSSLCNTPPRAAAAPEWRKPAHRQSGSSWRSLAADGAAHPYASLPLPKAALHRQLRCSAAVGAVSAKRSSMPWPARLAKEHWCGPRGCCCRAQPEPTYSAHRQHSAPSPRALAHLRCKLLITRP